MAASKDSFGARSTLTVDGTDYEIYRLDAVGGCWYDVLDRRRTAFTQLDDAQLAGAVALAERVLAEGDPLLRELDAQSLAWRGKPPKP